MRFLRLLASTPLLASALVAAPAAHALPTPEPSPSPAAVAPYPQLVDVRAVHRGGVDRVVFRFDAGAPSRLDVRFVDRLVADGSGRRMRIAGRAILQVGMSHTRTDVVGTAPRRRAFALPNVMTAVRSGLFEGWTTYGVGLARRTQVDVLREPARNRVVVAIRAGFATVDREVFFLDRDRFVANQEPFFVSRVRPVPLGSPAAGVLDRLFAGPLDRERRSGLRLVRSRATGFTDLAIGDGIARVTLLGRCSSGGSTVTVAGEIMPTLRQFDSVDWVKVLDPSGTTADPTGSTDSVPDCLNP